MGELRPDWLQDAACRGHENPSIFFPDAGECDKAREARAVCRTCPVERECYAEACARGEHFGIWGGVSFARHKRARVGLCDICGARFERTGQRDTYCCDAHREIGRKAQRAAFESTPKARERRRRYRDRESARRTTT